MIELEILFLIWGIPALIEIPLFIWYIRKEKEIRVDDLLGLILFICSSYFGMFIWICLYTCVLDNKVIWRKK